MKMIAVLEAAKYKFTVVIVNNSQWQSSLRSLPQRKTLLLPLIPWSNKFRVRKKLSSWLFLLGYLLSV